jgi:surface antigen
MQSNTLKVVGFLCALIILSAVRTVSVRAISNADLALTNDPFFVQAKQLELKEEALEKKKLQEEAKAKEQKQEAEALAKKKEQEAAQAPVQTVHTVQDGESLSTIATQYQTTWVRVFNKNVQVTDPNLLNAGQVLVIPTAQEQLAERVLTAPATVSQAATTGSGTRTTASQRTQITAPTTPRVRASSSGNTYAPGYCTWYAKNRRPDLPNRMGNAASWVTSAAAQGFVTGSAPRVGAIGQRGNHVVYVEAVNGDGTVTISEMNYGGRLYVVNSRTTAASAFTYIY